VEEFNCSTRVIDALLLSIQAVGAEIANCERERQTTRDDGARFDRPTSKQNLIIIVAFRPHSDDNFLSR
jgi:hypothetical protein